RSSASTRPRRSSSPSRRRRRHWPCSRPSSTPSAPTTTSTAPTARCTATPPFHYRVRHDRVDKSGRVTVRSLSRLHHVGIGCANKHQPITLLIANKDIRILAEDGTLLRQLTLDPNRDYQPRRVRPSRLKMSTMS